MHLIIKILLDHFFLIKSHENTGYHLFTLETRFGVMSTEGFPGKGSTRSSKPDHDCAHMLPGNNNKIPNTKLIKTIQ